VNDRILAKRKHLEETEAFSPCYSKVNLSFQMR